MTQTMAAEPAATAQSEGEEDGPATPPAPDTAQALKALRRPVAGLTRLGTVLGGLGALSMLVPFAGIAELGRTLLEPGPLDHGEVIATATVVAVALMVGWSCNGVALWLTHVADGRLQADLRRRMVAKLGDVGLGWYSETTSGRIRKAAQEDIDDLHHLVAHHDVELAGAIVLPLGGLGYLFWVDWRLALLALATLPVYFVAYGYMMRGFGDKMREMDAGFARVSATIVEFVHGIAVVKAFGRTNRAHAGYRRAVGEFNEKYAGWVRPVLRLEALTSMALSVPVIALVGLAGGIWFTEEGWVSPADVLAEVLVAVIIPSTLLTLNQGFTAQRKAVGAAERIVALLETPALPVAGDPRLPQGHDVVFDGVSFAYDSTPGRDEDGAADGPPGGATDRNPDVLDRVDLVCRPGTVTALVGASGAGKSTLAKLVPRFYDVTRGTVRIGGADVRDIAPRELYRHVGFVLQDVQLLHGTVADNLRLGRPDASDQELVEAAGAARIHERILQLPDGYDTVVGEDAVFSGGEAQRLAIARALLADTPVLVLDEATAYADPESEAEIQDALSTVVRGRTVLVIAHRLTTITGVDQIVVLDGGRVAERGTHTELLAADGRYARMWAAYAADVDTDPAPDPSPSPAPDPDAAAVTEDDDTATATAPEENDR